MSTVQEVKARINIVDLVARHVQLYRAGRSYKACCPFHTEKTPSFVVNPERGTWYCFGACHEGGDVFSFLMKRENISFFEALQTLSKEAGIPIGHGAQENYSRLYAVNQAASEYYQKQLLGSPKARTYLQSRGITPSVTKEFGLGYSPDAWTGLKDSLLEQGYSIQEMLDAGLIRVNSAGSSHYDFFRNRLMIPIDNEAGQIIGFGGRALGEEGPKYINTADTAIFHKSQVIYGLRKAKDQIRKKDCVVIMEGYMDVIAAHQYGFCNSVACMGTALSENQIVKLRRHARTFDFAMDSDVAGQQAVIRGLNQVRQIQQAQDEPRYVNGKMLLGTGQLSHLWVIGLPSGTDPDNVIREDPKAWEKLIAQSKPLIQYYLDLIASRTDLTTAEGKSYLVKEAAPILAELTNEVERTHYIGVLSQMIATPLSVVQRQLASATEAMPRVEQPKPVPQPVLAWEQQMEIYVLALCFSRPELFLWLSRTCIFLRLAPYGATDIVDTQNKELFAVFYKKMAMGESGCALVAKEYGRYIAALPDMEVSQTKESLLRVVIQLRKRKLTDVLGWIGQYIVDAQKMGQMEDAGEYQKQLLVTRKALYELDRAAARVTRMNLF